VVVVATGVCWAPPNERAFFLFACLVGLCWGFCLQRRACLLPATTTTVFVYICVCVCARARVPAVSLPLSFVRVSCLLSFHTLHLLAGLLWFLWLFPAVFECENPLVAKLLLLLLLILLVVGQLLFCTTLWV
jgi:hypothetical protein